MEWTKVEPPAGLVARVKQLAEARVSEALKLPEKSERAQALAALRATIQEQLAAEFPENTKDVAYVIEDIEYRTMREQVLTHRERVDGRDLDTVRPISCEVGVLPRTHGSALFTRGQDRKSTRLNSSHTVISYAVFCLKKKKNKQLREITVV